MSRQGQARACGTQAGNAGAGGARQARAGTSSQHWVQVAAQKQTESTRAGRLQHLGKRKDTGKQGASRQHRGQVAAQGLAAAQEQTGRTEADRSSKQQAA